MLATALAAASLGTAIVATDQAVLRARSLTVTATWVKPGNPGDD